MASTDKSNSEDNIFQYEDETETQKLTRKTKNNPFMPIGLTGCTLAVIYGAYRFKHRGSMSTSNYLMQLRVAAQGTVIGCLSIGLCYQLYQRFMHKPMSGE